MIKFKCPHCQKAFSVKDELAGKKAQCVGCKQVLTIPAAPPPAADLEELAAAALAEGPAPAPAVQETKTIRFTCAYCDAPVSVSADLAGKQTPCPECKHILKVPLPVKNEPVDWRKPDKRLPTGARRDLEAAPEGAWGSTTSTSTVSPESLEEAGAAPVQREPLTRKQWAVRGGVAAALVGVLVIGFLVGSSWLTGRRQKQALERALQAVTTDAAKAQVSRETQAEVHRAAGEYYLHTNKRDCATEALKHFNLARSALVGGPSSSERDALLIDLALTQLDLGSDQEPLLRENIRLSWDRTLREVAQTLQNLRSSEAKAQTSRDAHVEGLRVVCRELLNRDLVPYVLSLANTLTGDPITTQPPPDDDGNPPEGGPSKKPAPGSDLLPVELPEGLAVVGLELLRAGKKNEAEMIADRALRFYPAAEEANVRRAPVSAAVVALCLCLENKRELPREGKPADDLDNLRAGQALALAWQGKPDQARELLKKVQSPPLRLQALLTMAAQALEGQAEAEEVLPLVDNELTGKKDIKVSAWLLFRLALDGLQAELAAERIQRLTEAIKDPALQGRVHLAALRTRLKNSKDKAADDWLDAVKPTPAHGLACEALARHNARLDRGMAKTVEGWDESLRPLGYIGVALGLQDARR
jgi:tetratricopeptide (TPR) repeat protein